MLNVFTTREPRDAPKGDGAYDTILVSTKGKVGIITLNRPHALNALNAELIGEVNRALDGFEADSGIGCIVITGNDKAFAAGVDIKEMHKKTFVEAYGSDFLAPFDRISELPKTDHRRSRRIRARRRLRVGDGVRHYPRRRHRRVRPARDHARHHAGQRRHAASDPRGRQGQGHGALPHRAAHQGRGGRTLEPGEPSCRRRN
jgi:hypothetical protein